ncbi:hypothetical protein [Leptospira interrogans]|uniref:hypothetical protein n=1 Tax=Leptospira interrogans TaxID=173 RepID=UPI0002786291|nr:hypothetical protein [Leptospira interrogans]EJP13484.1 hypothetical protein LEP1GSC080_0239 [Leptospira interrogans str. FPW2026]
MNLNSILGIIYEGSFFRENRIECGNSNFEIFYFRFQSVFAIQKSKVIAVVPTFFSFLEKHEFIKDSDLQNKMYDFFIEVL